MSVFMLGALLAEAVYLLYPAPGVIVNGPAPMFANAEDAARCEDALWVDSKGLPDKTVSKSRYEAARKVCDKAQASLEPGVRVTVEGSFTLLSPSHPGLAAFRIQGLVVRSGDKPGVSMPVWRTSGFLPTVSRSCPRRSRRSRNRTRGGDAWLAAIDRAVEQTIGHCISIREAQRR